MKREKEMYKEYLNTIEQLLGRIERLQSGGMERAAALLSKTLCEDGLIYLFGCGHSHMLAEEGFYRAGGLGAVCPMLPSELMLHEGAAKSSSLERMSVLATEIIARYPISPRDSLVIFSNSGINGLPVEMARLGKEKGTRIICVSSGSYACEASRHPRGLRLSDICDVHIDNNVPYGDAGYELKGMRARMGPLSTFAGAYILDCLLARAAEMAAQSGNSPAIYVSGNVTGGREQNETVIARYRDRIRAL